MNIGCHSRVNNCFLPDPNENRKVKMGGSKNILIGWEDRDRILSTQHRPGPQGLISDHGILPIIICHDSHHHLSNHHHHSHPHQSHHHHSFHHHIHHHHIRHHYHHGQEHCSNCHDDNDC